MAGLKRIRSLHIREGSFSQLLSWHSVMVPRQVSVSGHKNSDDEEEADPSESEKKVHAEKLLSL